MHFLLRLNWYSATSGNQIKRDWISRSVASIYFFKIIILLFLFRPKTVISTSQIDSFTDRRELNWNSRNNISCVVWIYYYTRSTLYRHKAYPLYSLKLNILACFHCINVTRKIQNQRLVLCKLNGLRRAEKIQWQRKTAFLPTIYFSEARKVSGRTKIRRFIAIQVSVFQVVSQSLKAGA